MGKKLVDELRALAYEKKWREEHVSDLKIERDYTQWLREEMVIAKRIIATLPERLRKHINNSDCDDDGYEMRVMTVTPEYCNGGRTRYDPEGCPDGALLLVIQWLRGNNLGVYIKRDEKNASKYHLMTSFCI